jgi:hypothetical protein
MKAKAKGTTPQTSGIHRNETGTKELNATSVYAQQIKRIFWWIGSACLLLIIAVKAIRWSDASLGINIIVGIGPSLLGPIGVLFLILSSSGRLSRLTLVQLTLGVTIIALGLEFAQLLPRPGILAKVHYTFDWLDIVASLFSAGVGYCVARLIINRDRENHDISRRPE